MDRVADISYLKIRIIGRYQLAVYTTMGSFPARRVDGPTRGGRGSRRIWHFVFIDCARVGWGKAGGGER